MPNVIIRPGWFIPERAVTPEHVYRNRRQFLKEMGFSGAAAMLGLLAGCSERAAVSEERPRVVNAKPETNSVASAGRYPYARNPEFNPAGWRLSDEEYATGYNNFYEFSTGKTRVK